MSDDIRDVCIVSCDIVGHSRVADHSIQVRRIVGLNAVVHEALAMHGPGEVVWASGGDGGHVLFSEAHVSEVIDLAAALWAWAHAENVPLRVTCHVGPVSYCTGADGRTQPIGQGINHAGDIVAVAGDQGIVVSAEFRSAVHAAGVDLPRFHQSRVLSRRDKTPHVVCLMSLPDIVSHWPAPAEPEVPLPIGDRPNAWEALYRAKQRLQINPSDESVDRALRLLKPKDFWYECPGQDGDRDVNPFFGYLDQRALREVVRLGHLVERGYNEVICHHGDDGTTMFVILRGRVGVFHVEEATEPNSREPDFVLEQGQVVGELAFALNRSRTADLITLSDAALLAFSFEEFLARLSMTPGSERIRERVDDFITSRVLEHVATNVEYLVGHEQAGPLARGELPWESFLVDLQSDARVVTWQASDGPLNLDVLASQRPDTRGLGLYVLVSGSLASASNSSKRLRGEDLPLVYANIPGRLVFPDHGYVLPGGQVKFLHIGASALEVLPEGTLSPVVAAVKREVVRHYFYDVFVSYNFDDEDAAHRWSARLRDEGFRVFVDEPKPGTNFTANIKASLLDSVLMLAFISPHTMVKDVESNWVRKEIAYRAENFVPPWILPVGLPGADLNQFGVRYTGFDGRNNEDAAIAKTIDILRAIRSGREDPPLLKGPSLIGDLD